MTLKREGISLALFPLPFHTLLPRFLSFFTSCLRKREGKKRKKVHACLSPKQRPQYKQSQYLHQNSRSLSVYF